MREDKYNCDRCGKVILGGSSETTISVVTGRSMDASGNGYENDIEHVDLCLECCATLLQNISKNSHFSDVILAFSRIKISRNE